MAGHDNGEALPDFRRIPEPAERRLQSADCKPVAKRRLQYVRGVVICIPFAIAPELVISA
jgi:hypothetical protein